MELIIYPFGETPDFLYCIMVFVDDVIDWSAVFETLIVVTIMVVVGVAVAALYAPALVEMDVVVVVVVFAVERVDFVLVASADGVAAHKEV